jgi:hypothetical protein
VNLKKRDVIVISAGANDVYRNNPNEALMNIIKFIQNNGNTNIMILGIPRRHNLVEYSCVNKAIQVFNHKLRKVANSFKLLTIIECNYNRDISLNIVCILIEEVSVATDVFNFIILGHCLATGLRATVSHLMKKEELHWK